MCLGEENGADPPKVKSVERRCEAYGETPKIRNPNKHTGFNKFKNWRVIQWFKSLGEKPMTGFSHLALQV